MPLISIDGPEAVRIRKANDFALWGRRNEENRVEPVTRPAFDVPFELEPGEPIFTIGSCFARHVEGELAQRGFKIPMRDLFKTPEFRDFEPGIVNNFGVPSIYNEFAWAFGEADFQEQYGFYEAGKDKFIDLHLVSSVRPAALEQVRAQRQALAAATRSLAECRVLIMTLGLVELWWDTHAEAYLNRPPLPSAFTREPERFELHVLDFADCHRYLRDALDIAFRHGREDLQILLTVSPVPMMATHRRTDVISANSYSKSLLRAVAEHIVETDERVTYFPSFETVTMSDRRVAWADDFVHVKRDMVALNIERMVSAFTGATSIREMELPAPAPREDAETVMLAERARQARVLGDDAFFERHADQALSSPRLAIEMAHFLVDGQREEDAADLLGSADTAEAQILRAQILRQLGRTDEAIEAAHRARNLGASGFKLWREMIDCYVQGKNRDALLNIEREWEADEPKKDPMRKAYIGRALSKIGKTEEAMERLAQVVETPAHPPFATVLYAELLLQTGKPEAARELLSDFIPQSTAQANQTQKILAQCTKMLSRSD